MNEKPVGYLFGQQFCCPDCLLCFCARKAELEIVKKNQTSVSFYIENIFPYKQTCHFCKKIVVEGQSSEWCELFPSTKQVYVIMKTEIDSMTKESENYPVKVCSSEKLAMKATKQYNEADNSFIPSHYWFKKFNLDE